jgi:hypothetical protein
MNIELAFKRAVNLKLKIFTGKWTLIPFLLIARVLYSAEIGPVCSLEGVPVLSQGRAGRSDKGEATV